MMKIWIMAGEASGDVYGAKLARELRLLGEQNGQIVAVAGMGGPEMIKANVDIRVDSTELGVVGVVEVLKHIFTFVHIFFKLVKQAKTERPDAVVLIDYPGFNLLFALMMHFHKIKVVWYVSPHVWVWGKWRLPVLAKICDKMLVIFPFEIEVFAKTKLPTEFVGHPLLDIVKERTNPDVTRDPHSFVLLPGSRTMEITRLLVPMLNTVTLLHQKHPDLKFFLSAPRPKIADLCESIYQKYLETHPDTPKVVISYGDTPYWQQRAAAGLAASGTVTVESAIAGLPLVVGYKLNWVTILLASLVVRLYRGYFTMVNIIADKTVFEEYLQHRFSPDNLIPAIERILPGGSRRQEVEADMVELKQTLTPRSSSAARQAAIACYQAAGGKIKEV